LAVEQDTALIGIVETGQELYQRCLAGSVLADKGEYFTGAKREAEMAYSPPFVPRIHEPDVFEHEALADRLGERPRIIWRHDFRLDLEERKQIV
jgi:hypothetical protein